MDETSAIQILNFQPHKTVKRPKEAREAKHADLLKTMTLHLVDTYAGCSEGFRYTLQLAPRRVLTKLSKGVHNSGYDNAEHDYICRVGDKIMNPDNQTYEILERLGHGTFGQVLKCFDEKRNSVALKIIKNKPAYFHQALVEVHILKMLNQEFDQDDEFRIVRMRDFFVYRKHLCITFELLSVNLYDVLKQNSFRGVSMALIRVLTEQLLRAMQCLRLASIIHCDLKPENVLLSNMQHTKIKLIDFGSACFENHTVYSYIQSRFYRSPEVLLGLSYTTAIDMWSLGCICSELFLGLPIFPGHSEYDQVARHTEILGLPPTAMLLHGRNTRKYFRSSNDSSESDDGLEQPRRERKKKGEFDMQKCYELIILEDAVLKSLLRDGSFDRLAVENIIDIRHALQKNFGMFPSRREQGFCSLMDSILNGLNDGQEVSLNKAKVEEKQLGLATLLRDIEDAYKVNRPKSPHLSSHTTDGENRTDSEKREDATIRVVVVSRTAEPTSGAARGDMAVPAPDSSEGKDTSTTSTTVEQPPPETKTESLLDILKRKVGLLPPADTKKVSDSPTTSDAPERRKGEQSETSVDTRGADSEASTAPPSVQQAPTGDKKGGDAEKRKKNKDKPTEFRLKTREEYERDEHRKEPIPKKYFDFRSLHEMVQNLPYKQGLSKRAKQEDKDRRRCFLQFLEGALNPNPDLRWTPRQAVETPFICGCPYYPDFKAKYDRPVPSFLGPAKQKAAEATAGKITGNIDVPPLPKDALTAGNFSGGGSARTYAEKGGNSEADRHPQSAPASTRGEEGATKRPEISPAEAAKRTKESKPTDQLWEQLLGAHKQLLNNSMPLPEDNPVESYRPPIDQLCEDFFRTSPRTAIHRAYQDSKAKKTPILTQSHKRKSTSDINSVSVGGSFCSSASSTGSTPNPRHGQPGHAGGTPPSVGSPMSLQGETRKSAPALTQSLAVGSPSVSGGSPMPNPKDQATTQGQPKELVKAKSNTPISSTHTPQGGIPHTAHTTRVGGSQSSRGSSPWHLPSPMSELSTASERVNSSQLSGSDSCGETALPHEGERRYNLDDHFLSGEDPSQSDSHWRSHQPSDSDGTLTPGSHDQIGNRNEEEQAPKYDAHHALWENIKSEMQRVELSRDRLPRRYDITQSPGSASTMGNFREKMGMNESGPVIPLGHGARRDPNTAGSLFSPPCRQQPEGSSQQDSGNPGSTT